MTKLLTGLTLGLLLCACTHHHVEHDYCVTDEQGKPLAGVEVRMRSAGSPKSRLRPVKQPPSLKKDAEEAYLFSTVTDADGRFHLKHSVRHPEFIQLFLSKPGYYRTILPLIQLHDDTKILLLDKKRCRLYRPKPEFLTDGKMFYHTQFSDSDIFVRSHCYTEEELLTYGNEEEHIHTSRRTPASAKDKPFLSEKEKAALAPSSAPSH